MIYIYTVYTTDLNENPTLLLPDIYNPFHLLGEPSSETIIL